MPLASCSIKNKFQNIFHKLPLWNRHFDESSDISCVITSKQFALRLEIESEKITSQCFITTATSLHKTKSQMSNFFVNIVWILEFRTYLRIAMVTNHDQVSILHLWKINYPRHSILMKLQTKWNDYVSKFYTYVKGITFWSCMLTKISSNFI